MFGFVVMTKPLVAQPRAEASRYRRIDDFLTEWASESNATQSVLRNLTDPSLAGPGEHDPVPATAQALLEGYTAARAT